MTSKKFTSSAPDFSATARAAPIYAASSRGVWTSDKQYIRSRPFRIEGECAQRPVFSETVQGARAYVARLLAPEYGLLDIDQLAAGAPQADFTPVAVSYETSMMGVSAELTFRRTDGRLGVRATFDFEDVRTTNFASWLEEAIEEELGSPDDDDGPGLLTWSYDGMLIDLFADEDGLILDIAYPAAGEA